MAKRKNKETEYRAAVEAVADAAAKAEGARRRHEEGWRTLLRDKADAEKELQDALTHLVELRKERDGKS
jgi:hypothetical protein